MFESYCRSIWMPVWRSYGRSLVSWLLNMWRRSMTSFSRTSFCMKTASATNLCLHPLRCPTMDIQLIHLLRIVPEMCGYNWELMSIIRPIAVFGRKLLTSAQTQTYFKCWLKWLLRLDGPVLYRRLIPSYFIIVYMVDEAARRTKPCAICIRIARTLQQRPCRPTWPAPPRNTYLIFVATNIHNRCSLLQTEAAADERSDTSYRGQCTSRPASRIASVSRQHTGTAHRGAFCFSSSNTHTVGRGRDYCAMLRDCSTHA